MIFEVSQEKKYHVEIVRSRRKTVSLSVKRTGEIVVRAPLYVKDGEVARFVARHRDWLIKRIAEVEGKTLNLSDGESLTLFGNKYVVMSGRAKLTDGNIMLPEEGRETAFAALLKKQAGISMSALTQEIAREFGFPYRAVRISSARSRWGSCSKSGTISYSFRVAFLPEELARYVAVHELCHTRYFNHSALFWREVKKILPDYQILRKRLKQCGFFMNYL